MADPAERARIDRIAVRLAGYARRFKAVPPAHLETIVQLGGSAAARVTPTDRVAVTPADCSSTAPCRMPAPSRKTRLFAPGQGRRAPSPVPVVSLVVIVVHQFGLRLRRELKSGPHAATAPRHSPWR